MFDKIIFMSFLLIILLHKSKSTTVYKCGSKNKEVLNNTLVMFENCTISRCPLKKNSTMHIEIKFKPDFDVKDLITEVYGIVLNIPIPLLGVDKKNVCTNIIEEDGTKKNCPLQKGSTYIYKDDIYIIETYPKFKIDVHWSLKDPISRNVITCFEVPAKIID
ncbi:ecdysteroid-regulated 16 kDa protein-like isoform X1 [Sipha flava]|uniref:Ecdysteroid-regulated 16 kDa protein-like isoform X1 n=1 Tax=Sipha flava TaxID=143950 RepID=A0A8B8FPH4_9HEMI|nr:ecdysteroid-regulated 16 kDa protein-like isoform X1 [Sipha flava]